MSDSPRRPSSSYSKFLRLVNAVREMPAFPQLDPIEERLLNQFAAKWEAGKQVTVVEAMTMSPDASARTVHRRLKTLFDKSWITYIPDPQDSRVRCIAPTDQTIRFFEELGLCMDKALKD